MSRKQKLKNILKKLIIFIINVIIFLPITLLLLPLNDFNIEIFSPQLSEETVLSLSDNLSKISNGYESSFNDKNFKIEQYKGGGHIFGKYVATIWKEPFYITPFSPKSHKVYVNFDAVFYYDTISNCDKYYEVSYDPVTQKALCIYSDYSFKIRNPFSAKVIKKDND